MTVTHVAGAAWITACLAAVVHAAVARRPLEMSGLAIVVAAALLVWLATAVAAAVVAGRTTWWHAA